MKQTNVVFAHGVSRYLRVFAKRLFLCERLLYSHQYHYEKKKYKRFCQFPLMYLMEAHLGAE